MIYPKYIVSLLINNIEKTRNPLGIPNSSINNWWKNLDIKRDGDWLLFTGLLYQITPYIDFIVNIFEKIEDSKFQHLIPLTKPLPKSPLKLLVNRNLKDTFDKVLRDIYTILNNFEDVYYLPELDFYSGILLHDFGKDEAFEKHTNFVTEKLESAGVHKIVTVDPHTTFALRVLYPKKFKIKTYFETLAGKVQENYRDKVKIHDPCYYGRFLEISDVYRNILDDLGVKYEEVRNSKKLTSCCGGIMEALSPKISKEISKLRLEELGDGKIITLCPICFENLRKAGGNVEDFVEIIKKGSPIV
uniref:(Fe-S)-binding protein n=1 Tax=Geoglobus ahangari TaxID=113653 RepID=A0A7C3UBS2_9EURY